MRAPTLPWHVLVPVKDATGAKTRLDHPERSALGAAMTADVLSAARAAVGAERVIAVDDRGRGLDGDVLAAVAALAGRHAPVAVLMGDLPAVRAVELRAALAEAADVDRGVVADAAGTGTALLTARHATLLLPSYGAGSRTRHVEGGATDLSDHAGPGLRRDVDTADDLEEAIRLGVGAATAAVLGALAGVTTASYDAATGAGAAVTDAGERITLPAGPVAAAGLLHLRPGQRLTAWVREGEALAVRVGGAVAARPRERAGGPGSSG